jgi:hypothetical protein
MYGTQNVYKRLRESIVERADKKEQTHLHPRRRQNLLHFYILPFTLARTSFIAPRNIIATLVTVLLHLTLISGSIAFTIT